MTAGVFILSIFPVFSSIKRSMRVRTLNTLPQSRNKLGVEAEATIKSGRIQRLKYLLVRFYPHQFSRL